MHSHRRERRDPCSHWKSVTVALFLVVVSLGTLSVPRVHAPLEVYTLYLSQARLQESNNPGETLFINVTNAAVGVRYQFTFSVQDPSGAGKNAIASIAIAPSSFVLSVVYPRDFGAGVSIRYVGNYTVNVAQNQPSNKPTVATGQFQVGLTDSKTYQRTSTVFIEATGFATPPAPPENITISLVQGATSALGFPKWKFADSLGNFNFSWRVPPSEAIGSYTLTLRGSATTKSVPDAQTLSVSVTTIVIPGMTVKSSIIPRSLTQQLILAPQYPDGYRLQTGQTTVRIVGPDGTILNTTAGYDNLTGTFHAASYVPRNAAVGIWIATIDPNKLDDGYGNLGPALAISAGFNVQPASLNVSIISAAIGLKTYAVGDIIPLYVSVSYPDGSSFSTGSVIGKLTHNGVPVGAPVPLSYIPGQQAWAGSYQVTSNDPSGIWLITVDASDQIGDGGEGTYSAAVNVPPTTPSTWLTTSFFLMVSAIIAAAVLAILLWMIIVARKRVTHTKVKLDMRVIDKEVARIQESQFFQNIKRQVDEKGPATKASPTAGRREGEDHETSNPS